MTDREATRARPILTETFSALKEDKPALYVEVRTVDGQCHRGQVGPTLENGVLHLERGGQSTHVTNAHIVSLHEVPKEYATGEESGTRVQDPLTGQITRQ